MRLGKHSAAFYGISLEPRPPFFANWRPERIAAHPVRLATKLMGYSRSILPTG